MHVLLIASYAPSLLNFRGPLIKSILEHGNKVSVIAPSIPAEVRERLAKIGAEVHQVNMQRNEVGIVGDLFYLSRLFRLITEIRPDIALTYTIKPNVWGGFACRLANVRSFAMVTGLGFAFSDSHRDAKSRLSAFLARLLYRLSAGFNFRVIFQNPDDRDDFIAAGCLKNCHKALLVDGSGVDLEHYTRAPLPSIPVFLMIARLLVSKGVIEYVESAKRVREIYPEARFILAGPVERGMDAINPELIKGWQEQGDIEYRGELSDVREVLSEASVYVLPSYREGTPRTVLEAMATGRAIITTDVPGCRETIRNGQEGFLVEPRDSAALVDAIKRFLNDPSLAQRMATSAYARAQEKYDVVRINQQMMKAIGLLPVTDKMKV